MSLRRTRDKPGPDIQAELELELDRSVIGADGEERVALVLRLALRNVDMHGWRAAINDDGSHVDLQRGSVPLELGLRATSRRISRMVSRSDDRACSEARASAALR